MASRRLLYALLVALIFHEMNMPANSGKVDGPEGSDSNSDDGSDDSSDDDSDENKTKTIGMIKVTPSTKIPDPAEVQSVINTVVSRVLPGRNLSREFVWALHDIATRDSANPICTATVVGNEEMTLKLLFSNASAGNVECVNKWTPLHFAVALERNHIFDNLLSVNYTNVSALAEGQIAPLHLAVVIGHNRFVEKLIQRGAMKNQKADSGLRPIDLAVLYKQHEIIRLLIVGGANLFPVHFQDNELNVLNYVASVNRTNLLDLLLRKSDIINVRNVTTGARSLHSASLAGDLVAVLVLLERNSYINDRDRQGRTPLDYAASSKEDRRNIINALIKKGANAKLKDNLQRTALHKAVKSGRLDHVEGLLGLGIVNFQDYQLTSPLHMASGDGNLGMVKSLIQSGADVNATDKYGQTPLHLAVRNDNFAVVHTLIESGSSVNAEDKSSLTPLHLAVIRNDISTCLYLMKNGADPFFTTNQVVGGEYKTPLHLAVVLERINILKSFLKKEVPKTQLKSLLNTAAAAGSLEVVEYLGDILPFGGATDTSLCSAAKFGHLEVIEYLVGTGKVNYEGPFSPLCCVNDDSEVVELFLKEGADTNVTCYGGDSPIMRAVQNGYLNALKRLENPSAKFNCSPSTDSPLLIALETNTEMAKHLISEGCDATEIIVGDEKLPLLLYVIRQKGRLEGVKTLVEYGATVKGELLDSAMLFAAEADDEEVILYLKNKGADINARNGEGATPLLLAASNGNIRAVRCLLENGADKGSQNSNGSTPLHVAAEKDHHEVISMILPTAFINEIDILGHAPLSIAALKGNLLSVKALLENGVQIQIEHKSLDGSRPLHLACDTGKVETVEYLISKEANVNAADNEGRTPLHRAASSPNDEFSLAIAKTLIDHGAQVNSTTVEGKTPLHMAARAGNLNTVKHLLRNGADINSKDAIGDSPLFDSILSGNLEVVKSLIEEGATVKSLNNYKESPLDYATRLNGYCKTWCSGGSQAPQFHEDLLDMVNFLKKQGLQ